MGWEMFYFLYFFSIEPHSTQLKPIANYLQAIPAALLIYAHIGFVFQ